MASEVLIRPYEPQDRQDVRQICCDTADRGEPVENFFSDRELVADLVTRYHTDFEPESSWVAEADRRVVGYLTGCLDTRQWRRVMLGRIAPGALARAVGRGVLGRADTWRLLAKAAGSQCRWRPTGNLHVLDRFPAHVHINVRREFRGQRIGQELMERFVARVKERALPGLHARVSSTNAGGRRFFESMGFAALNDYGTTGSYTVIYGRDVGN